MTQLIEAPAGLKGVAVTDTAIGDVRGAEGFYHYRQYDATKLARDRTFEDVWHLLHVGDLPDDARRADFAKRAAARRAIPGKVAGMLPAIAALAADDAPLAALRAAYELVVLEQPMAPWLDISADSLGEQALATVAVFPTLVAALYRLAREQTPVAPRDDLGHVANYLYMLTGAEPDPARTRALETYLISTIDHGFNASTFTGRVVASAGADLGSAVIAALGALSGPLHGGAPGRVLDMLDEIGEPERADAWIRGALARGEKLMGFGHAVYRTADPRGVLVLECVGLPQELFTSTFAVSRVVGWTAHIMEQAANNKIIRPSARYTGPSPR